MDEENVIQETNIRIERMEAINAINNCFNRYLQYLSLQHKSGVLECFALEYEDVSFESAKSGVHIGADSISRYFDYLSEVAKLRGMLYEQFTLEQVIEIAGNGKTAKLTSLSPGLNVNAGARVQAWNNGKFYIDFIKTANGEWKIWHLHRFSTYEAELERGPLHTQYTHDIEMSYKEMADCYTANPDKPTTYFRLFSPDTVNYVLPEPPAPYEEWERMTDLVRTRPYQNPDIQGSMKGEVESIVRLGRGDEGYGKAW